MTRSWMRRPKTRMRSPIPHEPDSRPVASPIYTLGEQHFGGQLARLRTLLILLWGPLFATGLHSEDDHIARPDPIRGEAAIASAIEQVVVAEVGFELPPIRPDDHEFELKAQRSVWFAFANQSADQHFAGLVYDRELKMWDRFAVGLIAKARIMELDAESLGGCLTALNGGRNRQTAYVPAVSFESPFITKDMTPEQFAEAETKAKRVEAEYQARLKYRDEHIEEFYPDDLAIVPLCAYRVSHAGGAGWIVVCRWEYLNDNDGDAARRETTLGHIMIWAMDAASAEVLTYVSCD